LVVDGNTLAWLANRAERSPSSVKNGVSAGEIRSARRLSQMTMTARFIAILLSNGARQLPRIPISRRYVGRCKIAERAHLFEHARGRPVTTPRSAPTEPRGALALLFSRRFGPLFATQFLSAFNDNAVRNALILMIAYSGDIEALSAQILIPLAGGLFMLPFFLCSATAGQLADAHDKAWLIRVIKLCEIPVMLVAAAGLLA